MYYFVLSFRAKDGFEGKVIGKLDTAVDYIKTCLDHLKIQDNKLLDIMEAQMRLEGDRCGANPDNGANPIGANPESGAKPDSGENYPDNDFNDKQFKQKQKNDIYKFRGDSHKGLDRRHLLALVYIVKDDIISIKVPSIEDVKRLVNKARDNRLYLANELHDAIQIDSENIRNIIRNVHDKLHKENKNGEFEEFKQIGQKMMDEYEIWNSE